MLTKDDFNKLKSLGVARVIVLALLLLSWQPCVQHKQDQMLCLPTQALATWLDLLHFEGASTALIRGKLGPRRRGVFCRLPGCECRTAGKRLLDWFV